jgi:hypothetical protein
VIIKSEQTAESTGCSIWTRTLVTYSSYHNSEYSIL